MKVGLLQCDDLSQDLQDRYGNYPELYSRVLSSAEDNIDWSIWRVHEGELPDDIMAVDVWLISGSKASVYEAEEWIAHLQEFVRLLWDERRPVIGVCFGHQMIAQALGGRVEKSNKGWGLGVATTPVVNPPGWMAPQCDNIRLVVSHQDQVTQLPPVSDVIASSDFCQYYIIQYDEYFLGVQGHPEFSTLLGRELVEVKDLSDYSEQMPQWQDSLNSPIDDKLFARWMIDFYQHALVEAQSFSLIRAG